MQQIKQTSIIDPETFEKIASAQKSVKFYLDDEKRKGIKLGDILRFIDKKTEAELFVKVSKIDKGSSVDQLIDSISLDVLGYPTREIAKHKVNSWFSKEDQKRLSVLAVFIERVK